MSDTAYDSILVRLWELAYRCAQPTKKRDEPIPMADIGTRDCHVYMAGQSLRELQQRRALAAVQAQPASDDVDPDDIRHHYVGSSTPQPASARPDVCHECEAVQQPQRCWRCAATLARVPAPAVSPDLDRLLWERDALRSAITFLRHYGRDWRHTEAVSDCPHCNLAFVVSYAERAAAALQRASAPQGEQP